MNKAFEKILERLRNLAENYGRLQFGFNDSCEIQKYVGMEQAVDLAIEIVQEVAEEFAPDICVGSNGWIPCSERLPEDNQKVIVQDFYGDITIEKMKINNGTKGFSDGDWWSSANNYLAWQPLPEPYKERE